jgi:photosystem II stability/assembly factor-like uncharacterized protein
MTRATASTPPPLRGRAGWGFFAMATLLLAVPALAVDWQELGPVPITNGPYTGRVSAIACSKTNANVYFVAGADGGVWRTTDGGTTWTPRTDQMPTTAMGALAIDPTNDNIIYAGTGEANYANHSRYGLGVFKSTDGGDTWVQLAESTFAGRCFSKIVINPQNPQILYASITRAGGFPEMAAAKGHPGATGPLGVFRSDDGGVTWVQLAGGLPNLSATDLAMDPTNPSILYAAIGHIFGNFSNGIYRTSNGGTSWTKLGGTGWPTSTLGRISVAVAPTQATRIYALVSYPADASGGGASTFGAYRSDNSGTSWTSLPIGSIQSSYGWYLSVISVQPGNANTVFMAGLDLYKSTTSGASWIDVTPNHVDQHALAWDALGRLVAGHDGGVSRTANLGTNWTALVNLGIIQFYAGLSTHPTNANYMMGGFQDNGSNIRSGAGLGWTQVFGGDGGWTQIDQVNPLRSFCEWQGSGNLYVSTNGGGSYNYSGSGISGSDRNAFEPPYLIDPTNSMRMLYATHRIYRSTNSGSSWTAISGDLTGGGSAAIRSIAIAPSDPNTVYAATNDGRVQRSTNGGSTFTLVLTGNPGWPRVTRELFVEPNNAQHVYLAGAGFGQPKVRYSPDGGTTWTTLDGNLPDVPVDTIAVDVRGRLPVMYAGADDGLYYSINGGLHWFRYGEGLPHACVIDLKVEPARARLIAATQGRGAWSIPIVIPGDMNGDGLVNFGDINPFVLALSNPALYAQQYPSIDANLSGDMNGDGTLNFGDINGFVFLLSS